METPYNGWLADELIDDEDTVVATMVGKCSRCSLSDRDACGCKVDHAFDCMAVGAKLVFSKERQCWMGFDNSLWNCPLLFSDHTDFKECFHEQLLCATIELESDDHEWASPDKAYELRQKGYDYRDPDDVWVEAGLEMMSAPVRAVVKVSIGSDVYRYDFSGIYDRRQIMLDRAQFLKEDERVKIQIFNRSGIFVAKCRLQYFLTRTN